MATPSKSSEKRRHKRLGTNVEAVMAIGDKSTIQCVILDFCEQGLFLHLKDPSIIGLQKGKNAKIYFSADTGAGKEYFQIDAQIARVADDGIGVLFENISESMFKALNAIDQCGFYCRILQQPQIFPDFIQPR